jgi:aspartyl-tRNA(Asn)/glutamyl-tRNA(Gln) amidotransferase subunit B
VAYARALHTLVRWIGICDGNMQEGSFRCDANVSVRRAGEKLGTRCEIKNLNSFRFMEQAIEYEARRQIGLIEDGGTVVQETRLFDPDRGETRSMRTKEEAHDYRYFPDPDLLPLVVREELIERMREELPELPSAKRERFVAELKLSPYDAGLLVESREKAEFFERALGAQAPAKLVANLVNGEVAARLNAENRDFAAVPLPPRRLAALAARVHDGTISQKIAKDVLAELWTGGADPDEVIERRGLRQVSDAGEIEKWVDAAIAAGAKQAEDYRAGKEKALQSLVGQVMKASQGKANPAQVSELLKKKLAR